MRRFAETAFLKLWISSSILFAFQTKAQDIPVGSWRTHFSYTNARIISTTGEKIFCAVENGLFSVEIANGSIRKLSKIDGLSDVGVSAMEYNADRNVLVIGYWSGLIDFVFEDRIESITEIANSDLEGNKQINDIAFFGTQTFVATELGIVSITNEGSNIKENFVQIGTNGESVAVFEIEIDEVGNDLVAKTNRGFQSGDLSLNLLDFNNWIHYPNTSEFEYLRSLQGNVHVKNGPELFQFQNNSWSDTNADFPAGSTGLFASDDQLFTFSDQVIYIFTGTNFESINTVPFFNVVDMERIDDRFYLADQLLGLGTLDELQNRVLLSPSGPLADEYSRIKVLNNALYGFHAPNPSSYIGTEKVAGYSMFKEGVWIEEKIENFDNISDVSMYEGEIYFSSIGDGLYIQSSGEIMNDIPLSDTQSDTIISALVSGRNLWISSFSNQEPLHKYDGDNWASYPSGSLFSDKFIDLAISEREVLWGSRADGIITVFDAEEDVALTISSANGLPGSVLDVEISIDDDPWVATTLGPATFADASLIVGNNEALIPSFENSVIFESEVENAIETDGGNRVWFATNRGLWIFDQNLSNQEGVFNFDNSPIPSDIVLDLAYNGSNGEMFILTNKGLVSYRSNSSVGARFHQSVNIFPNPVLPGYNGLVGIDGLATNTSIKITDVSGNLVKKVKANGSSASWDLKNTTNKYVVTGVYLFFSSTSDGSETYVGKIAVIR